MNSGKAKAVCSPVKAAADRYGPLAPAGIERPPGSGPSGRAARSACGMRALIGRGKLECKVREVWGRSSFCLGSEGALCQSELVPLADLPSCFVLIALVWLLSGVAAAEDSSLSVALVGLDGQQSTLTLPELEALARVKTARKRCSACF